MIITWLGHACFRLISKDGHTVVTDPFSEKVGYPPPEGCADIVTVSHEHHDHNDIGKLEGVRHVVRGTGRFEWGNISVTGIPTWHDDAKGVKRGENMVFLIEIDGVRIAHMGDLGHELTRDQISAIGKVDVLLLPVGGFYTIDAAAAARVMASLAPALTIPMHYLTPCINFPIATEEPFITLCGGIYMNDDRIEIAPDAYDKLPSIAVLSLQTKGD